MGLETETKSRDSVTAKLTSFFLCKGWCYGDTTVSWSPILIFELQVKKIISLNNSTDPFKKIFLIKKIFLKYFHECF